MTEEGKLVLAFYQICAMPLLLFVAYKIVKFLDEIRLERNGKK